MKKNTTETKKTKACLIMIIAAIIIILGAIGALVSTNLKILMICLVICALGIIIFDFARLFLYLQIDERDRLD